MAAFLARDKRLGERLLQARVPKSSAGDSWLWVGLVGHRPRVTPLPCDRQVCLWAEEGGGGMPCGVTAQRTQILECV